MTADVVISLRTGITELHVMLKSQCGLHRHSAIIGLPQSIQNVHFQGSVRGGVHGFCIQISDRRLWIQRICCSKSKLMTYCKRVIQHYILFPRPQQLSSVKDMGKLCQANCLSVGYRFFQVGGIQNSDLGFQGPVIEPDADR